MVLGAAMGLAALGTMIFSILGRWIGGAWTTMFAIVAAFLLVYQPIMNAPLIPGLSAATMTTTFLAAVKSDALRRIIVAAVPFTAVAMLLSLQRIPFLVRLLFALIGPAALLGWVFAHFDVAIPRPEFYTHKILPISLVIFITWLLIEPIAMRSAGSATPIVIGPLTAGLAQLLLLSADSQTGMIAAILPATALGALLAAIIGWFLGKPISFSRGPVIVWLTLIGTLFGFMWLDSEDLPSRYLYWIAAAPVLAWIVELPLLKKRKPWIRETVRLALVAIPVVVAVVLAFKQHNAEQKAAGDEYGFVQPHSAAPMCPSQIPMPNTIIPPTIT